MLRHTFQHVPGIGKTTEWQLWRSGILTWEDLLTANEAGQLRNRKALFAVDTIRESITRFTHGDWTFFDQRLPSHEKWRAFGELGSRALYLDIETTGMGSNNQITVIGTYDGIESHAFIAGKNLNDAMRKIDEHPLIVTFNGAQFDMPVIRNTFRNHLFNHLHIDLRYALRAIGFTGGLKKIEQQMGIQRAAATQGLDGWDAIRLWRDYKYGSKEALDLLLAYNLEDTKNLEALMKHSYQQLSEQTRRIMKEAAPAPATPSN